MKTRTILLMVITAAALAANLPGDAFGQDAAAPRPQPRGAVPSGGMIGVLQYGNWQCALPGDAGGAAFVPVPAESFTIGTASSYTSPAGGGIYLLLGNEAVFTRGPKKNQRFRVRGENSLQKLNADGSLSRLICTRLDNGA